jgi:N-acetylglutamate synthase-like GNAT family acetyltransferase
MIDRGNIVARRAQAGDGERVAGLVNSALRGRVEIDAQTVIVRLGDTGFFLAEQDDRLAGLIGWHVENLVACVTDLLIWPACERVQIGQTLFREMESAAMELYAEAALLLLPRPSGPELIAFCRALGYERRVVADLPRSWRQTAREAGREDDETILVKQLRSERVIRPL